MQWHGLPHNQKAPVTEKWLAWQQPPKKPPPPDPNRLGLPKPKGKGKAKAAMPEKETQANQPEGSSNYNTSQDKGLLKQESKKARKCWLVDEAEEAMAWETPADHKEVEPPDRQNPARKK
jgi:hypothetical protein